MNYVVLDTFPRLQDAKATRDRLQRWYPAMRFQIWVRDGQYTVAKSLSSAR